MKKRMISLLLVGVMAFGMAACGGKDDGGAVQDSTESGGSSDAAAGTDGTGGTYDTLVIGSQSLEGVFSPFFYSSAYDSYAGIDPVFANVCRLNRTESSWMRRDT